MRNCKTSQILMLVILAALLCLTPLLSSSVRPKYLYFIINLVIVALGFEAGLISPPAFFSKNILDHHQHDSKRLGHDDHRADEPEAEKNRKKMSRVVEKSASEKIGSVMEVDKVKKCPSMPSLFFIGAGDQAAEEVDKDEVVEDAEISGQELYTKAETFIGNFYKQLKMQREES